MIREGTRQLSHCGYGIWGDLAQNPKSSRELLAVWDQLNIVNGLTLPDDEGGWWRDCLTGHQTVHWAKIIPTCEDSVYGLMIWLRENGIIDSDRCRADIWKMSYSNMVPLNSTLASNMEYLIGGTLIMLSKKCLWRLCLLTQIYLVRRALKTGRLFRNVRVSDFTRGWDDDIGDLGMGWAYYEQFGEDYDPSRRSIEILSGDKTDEATREDSMSMYGLGAEDHGKVKRRGTDTPRKRVFIYEAHLVIAKNHNIDLKGEVAVHEKPLRYTRLVHMMSPVDDATEQADLGQDGDEDSYLEYGPPQEAYHEEDAPEKAKKERTTEEFMECLSWTRARDEHGNKHLPQDTVREILPLNSNKPREATRESVGPTFFGAFDPVPTVLMFWHTAQRLLHDETETFIVANQDFADIMALSDFFLRLCQCISPDQVWLVQPPPCYTEELPSIPESCNKTPRLLHPEEAEIPGEKVVRPSVRGSGRGGPRRGGRKGAIDANARKLAEDRAAKQRAHGLHATEAQATTIANNLSPTQDANLDGSLSSNASVEEVGHETKLGRTSCMVSSSAVASGGDTIASFMSGRDRQASLQPTSDDHERTSDTGERKKGDAASKQIQEETFDLSESKVENVISEPIAEVTGSAEATVSTSYQHPTARHTLDLVESRIAEIRLDKKSRFNKWVKGHGLFEALERQRQELTIDEDQNLVRLSQEAHKLKMEVGCVGEVTACDENCFDRIHHRYGAVHVYRRAGIEEDDDNDTAIAQESVELITEISESASSEMCAPDEQDVVPRVSSQQRKARFYGLIERYERERRRRQVVNHCISVWRKNARRADQPASQGELDYPEPTEEIKQENRKDDSEESFMVGFWKAKILDRQRKAQLTLGSKIITAPGEK